MSEITRNQNAAPYTKVPSGKCGIHLGYTLAMYQCTPGGIQSKRVSTPGRSINNAMYQRSSKTKCSVSRATNSLVAGENLNSLTEDLQAHSKAALRLRVKRVNLRQAVSWRGRVGSEE